ncbi:MAG TPA: hypothetical protein VGF95_01060 [Solirubrobacteraceae bacterium]|jgi:hypothetical protein
MKKFYALAAPVVAVVAFMAVPAMASAAPQWSTIGTVSSNSVSGTLSVLKTPTLNVVCNSITDTDTLEAGNAGAEPGEPGYNPFEPGAGTDQDSVNFEECEETNEECPVTVSGLEGYGTPVEVETFLVNTEAPGVFVNLFLPPGALVGNKLFAVLTLEGECGNVPVNVEGSNPVEGLIFEGSEITSLSGELEARGEKGTFSAETEQPGVTVTEA